MLQGVDWRNWILTEFKGSFESGFASDVIIKTREDHLIYSHRLLLGSYSSFLRDLFLETPNEDEFAVLLTPDISYSRLKSFLYTLYDENPPNKSNDHEVASLLRIDNWPFFQNDNELHEKQDLIIPEISTIPHKDVLIDLDPNLFPEDVNEFIKKRILDQCCPICKLDFMFHNQDGKGLFCCECEKEFACRKQFQEHAERHLKLSKNWHCQICNKTIREHRNKEEVRCVYRCCTCTRSQFKFKGLKDHLANHLRKKFRCPTCKKYFSKSESLGNHVTQEHSKNYIQLSCTYAECTFKTKYRQTLSTHVKEFHEGIKRSHTHPSAKMEVKCPHCFKSFKKRYFNQTHQRVCSENHSRIEYKCNLCGKSGFVNKTTLNNHIRAVHEGDTPYECKLCPENERPRYATSMALLAHTSRKHKKASNDKLKSNSSSRMHPCNLCGQLLSSSSNLKSHKKTIHGKERNFECNYCAKCFSSKSNLRIHEGSVHTGILPYKCNDCSKSFTRKLLLVKHINIAHRKFSPMGVEDTNFTNLQSEGNNCNDVTDFFQIPTD